MPAISFCGCSVTGFNSQLGWGSNKSSLDVNVIEDIRNGDFFNPPPMGMPCYFYFGPSFHFWGILQTWKKQNAREGLSIYNLRIEDPRDILAGTKLITNVYNGSTYGVPNILNCYGYWENLLGYGGASSTEGGMLWSKILTAVEALTNLPAQTTYGGPLQFRGVPYAVDLSLLPVPPAYYRLSGGPVLSLLDVIQQICDDGGCDFFVELDPGTTLPIIRVFTVSRYNQPPLGTITALTNTNWGGTVKRAENGLELRNQPTSNFIFGAEQKNLYQTSSLQPFWGYDKQGLPIDNMIVLIPGLGYCNAAYVNADEISNCLNNNDIYYFLTEFEMRAAMRETPFAWELYVQYETNVLGNNKSTIIGPLGMRNCMLQNPNPNAQVLADILAPLGTNDTQNSQQEQLKQFVKKIANNWYGRKYWVPLPFILTYTDPETLVVHNSQEPTDGGWLPDGSVPIGLYAENELKFMTDDGRFEALATYEPNGIALERMNPENSALQDNAFFTKLNVDNSVYLWPQTSIPTVLVTVDTPVEQEIADIGGDIHTLGVLLQQTNPNTWDLFQGNKAWGTMMAYFAPPRYQPQIVAIPLVSHISTYGPWYLAGPPGQVNVEQVPDLAPWEYGGTDFMNLAAEARVTSAVTLMQIAEMGQMEFVGMPLTSLGQRLLAGGPDITNIEIHYGGEGITTSYQFRTFTDTHLNRFIAGTQERIKRMGRVQNEVKKSILLNLQTMVTNANTQYDKEAGTIRRFPKWQVSWSSPAPVFIGSTMKDQTGRIRTSTAMCAPEEAWAGIGGAKSNTTLFGNSALCSLSAVVRPFANNAHPPSDTLLPHLPVPSSTPVLNINAMNPFFGSYNDVEYLVSGYNPATADYVVNRGKTDWDNVRGVCISAPMYMCGWGFDIFSKLTPPGNYSPPDFKVGPLDVLWEPYRCTWSVHDSIFGTLDTQCAPNGGTANMTIMGSNNLKLPVSLLFKTATVIPAGTIVCVNYQPYLQLWAIVSADCPQQ